MKTIEEFKYIKDFGVRFEKAFEEIHLQLANDTGRKYEDVTIEEVGDLIVAEDSEYSDRFYMYINIYESDEVKRWIEEFSRAEIYAQGRVVTNNRIIFNEPVEIEWFIHALQEQGVDMYMKYLPLSKIKCCRAYSIVSRKGNPVYMIDVNGSGYGHATGITSIRKKYKIPYYILHALENIGVEYKKEEVK